jgi:hypothetical protein
MELMIKYKMIPAEASLPPEYYQQHKTRKKTIFIIIKR